MILVFDIGNSRIKWAFLQAGLIIESGAEVSSVEAMQSLLMNTLVAYKKPEKVLAVNVAGNEIEQALSVSVQQLWLKDVQYLRSNRHFVGSSRTLTNAYSDPIFHGADRWAALIGASHEFSGALCVISAGTAITFDLLEANGRHLGGRILPSSKTMGKALLADAAAIDVTLADAFKSVEGDTLPLFASDTQGAISSGVHYLLAAGLREACVQVAEVLSQPPTFVVTGGGAEQLMQWVQMPNMEYRPDLILRGVYLALNNGEANE